MSDVIDYVDKQLSKHRATDVLNLKEDQEGSLVSTYKKVIKNNEDYIVLNLLKCAPSYDMTINFRSDDVYLENRMVLKKHVIKKLIDNETFDEEIGYLDTYQTHIKNMRRQRIPIILTLEKEKIKLFFPKSIFPTLSEREKAVKFASKIFDLFMATFFVFINPPKVKKVIEFAPKNIVIQENNKNRQKDGNPYWRELKPIKVQRVITINESGLERYVKTKGKEFKRFMNVWGVIGHVRHYKNGKKVFIKPYEKGKDRNKGLIKPREREL